MPRPVRLNHPSICRDSIDASLTPNDRAQLHALVLDAIDGVLPTESDSVSFGKDGMVDIQFFDSIDIEHGEQIVGLANIPLSTDALLAKVGVFAAVVTVWSNRADGPDSAVTLYRDHEKGHLCYRAFIKHYQSL